MKSNYTLFRIWGIPIRINISLIVFLPILAWLIGSGEQLSVYASIINAMTPATVDAGALAGNERWIVAISVSVGLFASVAFHELGHAWMALRYDIGVESITLWLLGGLASLSAMPKEWNREFWIAVAGPFSSLVLAGACIGSLYFIPESLTLVVFIVGFIGVMNVILAVFNMLPAFPMDGGRVLRSLLARNRSYVSATRTAARIGTGFAIAFLFLGVLAFAPLLILLALFIYIAATSESRSVILGDLLDGLTVADVLTESEPIDAQASAREVFDRMLGTRKSELAVIENGEIVGVVTGPSLKDLPFEQYDTKTAKSLATTEFPRLDAEMSAFDGMFELMRTRSGVAIIERDGVPVGVVSRDDFTSVLDIRRDVDAF